MELKKQNWIPPSEFSDIALDLRQWNWEQTVI